MSQICRHVIKTTVVFLSQFIKGRCHSCPLCVLIETLLGLDNGRCVWFHNLQPSFPPFTKGAPQGSVFGSVLFTIYINNTTSSLFDCSFHVYAGKTHCYSSTESIHDAILNLQLLFKIPQTKMSLNARNIKYSIY